MMRGQPGVGLAGEMRGAVIARYEIHASAGPDARGLSGVFEDIGAHLSGRKKPGKRFNLRAIYFSRTSFD